MSYPLLTLPMGLGWNYRKSPKFSNIKQVSQSGRSPANATLQSGTFFDFELTWNYLKEVGVSTANDLQYLEEFYEAMGGGLNWFLFDPSQNSLENLSVTQDYTQLKNGFCGEQPQNNFLLYSQALSEGVWQRTNIASVTDGIAAPDGGASGDAIVSGSGTDSWLVQYVSGLSAGWTVTFSIYLKVPSGTLPIYIYIGETGSGTTGVLCNATTSWQRFSVTRTLAAATAVFVQVGGGGTVGANVTFNAAWAILETGTVASSTPAYYYGSVTNGAALTAGIQTAFPMWRSTSALGAETVTLLERIQNVTLLDGVYSNGNLVASSEYTQTNLPGLITFSSPPAAGPISWGGNYCYLAQFSEDSIDFNEFLYQLWELKSLKIESVNL